IIPFIKADVKYLNMSALFAMSFFVHEKNLYFFILALDFYYLVSRLRGSGGVDMPQGIIFIILFIR
ncbi:MAG: hypothetical protein IJH37_02145, partial [Clostridia bacterium]|nr:hypothetical protein [Clostridia bacterium]